MNFKMKWLASKTFMAHSILSVMGLGWAWLASQPGLVVLFALLWGGAFVIWLEWKNG